MCWAHPPGHSESHVKDLCCYVNTDYNCSLKNRSEASQKMKCKESSFPPLI